MPDRIYCPFIKRNELLLRMSYGLILGAKSSFIISGAINFEHFSHWSLYIPMMDTN